MCLMDGPDPSAMDCRSGLFWTLKPLIAAASASLAGSAKTMLFNPLKIQHVGKNKMPNERKN